MNYTDHRTFFKNKSLLMGAENALAELANLSSQMPKKDKKHLAYIVEFFNRNKIALEIALREGMDNFWYLRDKDGKVIKMIHQYDNSLDFEDEISEENTVNEGN